MSKNMDGKPNILTSIADFQLLLGTLLSGLGRGFQQAIAKKEKQDGSININKKKSVQDDWKSTYRRTTRCG